MKSFIKINGLTLEGNNISIVNGKISIDGKLVNIEEKKIEIVVQGNLQKLEVDSCDTVNVIGDVSDLKTVSGDIICKNVTNGVTSTSGDIKCENVGGNVSTVSGDVEAKTITGKVSTVSGDIN